MSGITGWVSHDRDLRTHHEAINKMTATLRHRGPDKEGVWVQPHAALGHRLLVSDHTDSTAQPVTIETSGGPLGIVLDGQLYNRSDLRHELHRKGQEFLANSDAETVLRGYLAWGPGVAQRMRGVYAFAIWDGRSRELILVRDRMGNKPLYFYPLSDGLLFGSEPKAIFANSLTRRIIEAEGMCEIYSGFNRTPGNAVWSGMFEVRPAGRVTVSGADRSEHSYWQLTAKPHHDDQQTTILKARELLNECVDEQMPASDPYCVLLSGGLDSSVITGMLGEHARRNGRKVRTFTVDFAEQSKFFRADLVPARPDTPFARDVAEYVGAEHTEIIFDHEVIADPALRRTCVAARDLPVGFGDRDMSFYLMCQSVRKYSNNAMTGDGGGQTFGPYPAKRAHEADQSDPWRPRRIPLDDDALVDPKFLASIGRDDYLRNGTAATMRDAPTLSGENEIDRRVRASYFMSMTRMPHWATAERRDRISGRAGLEIRTPYFDHRIIEYLFNTPWPLKAFDGKEKSLLRAVGGSFIPDSIKSRQKKGYPGILHVRYTEALQHQVADLIGSNHLVLGFYDRKQVAAAVRQPPETVSTAQKFGMERLLDLAAWTDITRPTFNLP